MTTKTENTHLLTRRALIQRVSALLGGTLVGQSVMLTACSSAAENITATNLNNKDLFGRQNITLLDEIADTLLPETDTPGAKAANVGAFMALMVTDTYYAPDQTIFLKGLESVNARSNALYGSDFVAASASDQLALLKVLDAEQHAYMAHKRDDEPAHYFRMMKELALLGYFTSEIGYTQAMRYEETPGRYAPCIPYAPGDKIWANHA